VTFTRPWKLIHHLLTLFVQFSLLACIHAYRLLVSPSIGPSCRYLPSCSAYAEEAVLRHGPVRGGWLALRRVARCHPFRSGGVDLVPEGRERGA
jgi:putative membrane protein insertion efficiency factor